MGHVNSCIPKFLFKIDILGAGIKDDPLRRKLEDIVIIWLLVFCPHINSYSMDIFERSSRQVDFHSVNLPFPEADGTYREPILKQFFHCKTGVPFLVRAGT